MKLKECKSCSYMIYLCDDLSYGCPNCESPFIGKYTGIIGEYTRRNSQFD
jgi:RNA polymerase subunit RPABC4/transcription elongation factor Spt4